MSGDVFNFWLLVGALAAAAAYSCWVAIEAWGRNRAIEDTPTSRIRSAAQGYVELSGRGMPAPDAANIGPLSGKPCAWWRYHIEQRSGARSRSWSTVQKGISDQSFLLDDGTGKCRVDPRGAQVFPAARDVWYGPTEWPQVRIPDGTGVFGKLVDACIKDKYRYMEERLELQEHLCAMGAFRSDGGVSIVDPDADVTALLHDWKQDQAALLARFDADHDGTLSAAEWERARAVARREVLERRSGEERPPSGGLLADPLDGRAFLLSASDGASLAGRFRRRAAAGAGGFVASAAALAWVLTHV